jgi:hypothetical protein
VRTVDVSERQLREAIPGMKEVSDLIQSYTYPLFRYDGNGRPTLFASCIFLEVDEYVFSTRIEHVIEFIRERVRPPM